MRASSYLPSIESLLSSSSFPTFSHSSPELSRGFLLPKTFFPSLKFPIQKRRTSSPALTFSLSLSLSLSLLSLVGEKCFLLNHGTAWLSPLFLSSLHNPYFLRFPNSNSFVLSPPAERIYSHSLRSNAFSPSAAFLPLAPTYPGKPFHQVSPSSQHPIGIDIPSIKLLDQYPHFCSCIVFYWRISFELQILILNFRYSWMDRWTMAHPKTRN